MRSAPSVVYPVGRSAFYGMALTAIGSFGGAVLVWGCWRSWQLSPDHLLWGRWLSGGGLWLTWILFAVWMWSRLAEGVLKWDALATPGALDASPGAWYWMPRKHVLEPLPVRLERVFDWQERIFLCLHFSSRRSHWVWLERTTDPSKWDDMRRALVGGR